MANLTPEQQAREDRLKAAERQGLSEYVNGSKAFQNKFGEGVRMRNGAPLMYYTASSDAQKELTDQAAKTPAQLQSEELTPQRKKEINQKNQDAQLKSISWVDGKPTTRVSIRIRNGAPLLAFDGSKEATKLRDMNRTRANVEEITRYLYSVGTGITTTRVFGTWTGEAYGGYDEQKFRESLKAAGYNQEKYTSGDLEQAVFDFSKKQSEVQLRAAYGWRYTENSAPLNIGWSAMFANNKLSEDYNLKYLSNWKFENNQYVRQ